MREAVCSSEVEVVSYCFCCCSGFCVCCAAKDHCDDDLSEPYSSGHSRYPAGCSVARSPDKAGMFESWKLVLAEFRNGLKPWSYVVFTLSRATPCDCTFNSRMVPFRWVQRVLYMILCVRWLLFSDSDFLSSSLHIRGLHVSRHIIMVNSFKVNGLGAFNAYSEASIVAEHLPRFAFVDADLE